MNTHLPNGTYWCCSSSYNGLSKIEKFNPNKPISELAKSK